jgi:hypothetical protein
MGADLSPTALELAGFSASKLLLRIEFALSIL